MKPKIKHKDFFDIVKDNPDLGDILHKYNGDKTLNYSSDGDIKIKESSLIDLNKILDYTLSTNIEVAFGFLYDDKENTIIKCISGGKGDSGFCDWLEGNFIKDIISQSKKENLKILLAHTHPTWDGNEYGGICSKIFYSKSIIKQYMTPKNKEMFNHFINSGDYKKYGGDYIEQLYFHKNYENVTDLFMIASPGTNQIGIFKVGNKGKITYKKWEIVN